MIENNSVSRYLLYAVGEIILVVIGILIALQINNWNEERKERAEELQTLKNIKSDFINTIDEFKENNVFRERILNSTNTLFSIIHTGQPNLGKPQLDSLLSHLFVNPTYNGQSETLNILFNSGKINIIQNDSIKQALVIWPQQVEDITEDEIYSSNLLFNFLQPVVKDHVSLYDIYSTLNFKNYQLFSHTRASTLPNNYKELFTDRNFEGALAARELPISISLQQSAELIASASEVIRLINSEIQKLED